MTHGDTKGIPMAKNTWGNSNHSAEPWGVREIHSPVGRARTKSLCIVDADNDFVLTVVTIRANEEFAARDSDNAFRIVECVNACKQ